MLLWCKEVYFRQTLYLYVFIGACVSGENLVREISVRSVYKPVEKPVYFSNCNSSSNTPSICSFPIYLYRLVFSTPVVVCQNFLQFLPFTSFYCFFLPVFFTICSGTFSGTSSLIQTVIIGPGSEKNLINQVCPLMSFFVRKFPWIWPIRFFENLAWLKGVEWGFAWQPDSLQNCVIRLGCNWYLYISLSLVSLGNVTLAVVYQEKSGQMLYI